ncbi:MAG: gamma-glutamyltransferase [bacterium]|jgi:gamma-glutamyltranspeptidase/glutathione hydrolase
MSAGFFNAGLYNRSWMLCRLFALLAIAAVCAPAAREPVRARNAMVVTREPHATDAGIAVLKAGGNAVDAAVAVGFALTVTHPASGSIGGGGFMLIRFADGRTTFIDFREQAPETAAREMYAASPRDSIAGWRASGVPGTVRGFELASNNYGSKPWSELVAPAIALARDGFTVSRGLARSLRNSQDLAAFEESKRIFLKGGAYWEAGEQFVQPELAATLERIARGGAREFYAGETARMIARAMAEHGGTITLDDLRRYEAVEREPLTGQCKGFEIITAPPPSSGGIGLLEMMGILDGTGYEKHGHGSAAAIHWVAEAMRRFFADRSEHMGDPDFARVPVRGLIDPKYVAELRRGIDPEVATPSVSLRPGRPQRYEPAETTHYSIVDAAGNAVAVTYTLNGSFGSGVTVPGAGFLLNNEMDDFTTRPGVPNMFGLVQGEANAIEPRKRPLSSMTPTIVLRDGRLFMVAGSPGGPRIISTVLNVLLNAIDFGMNAQEAVDAPRFHHQWLPDTLFVEPGISPDTLELLKARGYAVETAAAIGEAAVIMVGQDGWLQGAADLRSEGKAAGY